MKNISWVDGKDNQRSGLAEPIRQQRLINTIRTRQKKWIGCILREETCLLEKQQRGRWQGKHRGQPKTMTLEWMFDPTSKNKHETQKKKDDF